MRRSRALLSPSWPFSSWPSLAIYYSCGGWWGSLMASSVHVRALCVPNTTRLAGSCRAARHLAGAVKRRLRQTRPQLEKNKEIKMLLFKFDCSAADRQTSRLRFVHISARHHCKPHKSYKNRKEAALGSTQ